MKKFSANPIITEQMIQTSFNCSIELRDRLELDESLKRHGF